MIELTSDDLKYFSEFEKITRVTPNDYTITPNTIVFLVNQDSLGKAIGKNGMNINRLKSVFKKRVIVVADSNDPEIFLKNMFYNINILSVEMREAMGEKTLFVAVDEKDRGIAIGKDGERIKMIKTFLKEKFKADLSLKTRRVLE